MEQKPEGGESLVPTYNEMNRAVEATKASIAKRPLPLVEGSYAFKNLTDLALVAYPDSLLATLIADILLQLKVDKRKYKTHYNAMLKKMGNESDFEVSLREGCKTLFSKSNKTEQFAIVQNVMVELINAAEFKVKSLGYILQAHLEVYSTDDATILTDYNALLKKDVETSEDEQWQYLCAISQQLAKEYHERVLKRN